jgi:hypothetical protein
MQDNFYSAGCVRYTSDSDMRDMVKFFYNIEALFCDRRAEYVLTTGYKTADLFGLGGGGGGIPVVKIMKKKF